MFTLFYMKHFVLTVFLYIVHTFVRQEVLLLTCYAHSIHTVFIINSISWWCWEVGGLLANFFSFLHLSEGKEKSRWRQTMQNTWHVELSYDWRQAIKCMILMVLNKLWCETFLLRSLLTYRYVYWGEITVMKALN